jgi:ribonuclease HII
MQPSFLIENNFETNLICGIDEVGRGPLAGPVVACCYLMNKNLDNLNINDSKKLSKRNRQKIYQYLINNEKFAIGVVGQEKIDKINILQATLLAMKIAYENFCEKYQIYPQIILVDGNISPFAKTDNILQIIPVVKGDQKSNTIACASIIAKEYRDNLMEQYHQKFPDYEFNKHYGYGTKLHLERIQKFGVCEIHRQSFEPIKSILKCKL